MDNHKKDILIATGNAGKVKELQSFLAGSNFRLQSLSDFPAIIEVEETGETFTENAVLKAESYALQTKTLSLADDSGLEVEALGGAPGVYSARYAGENTGDAEKISKLLDELKDTPDEKRRAKFVCVMAIADENGKIQFIAEGICCGKISLFPIGANGFGYDPIFIPDGFEQTFGELNDEIKQQISHRARAIAKIIQFLRGFTASQLDQSTFRL